ncbi:MAG: hypothetical protein GX896_08435, partial [Clostridiales bacterium]|nr:hypothetical protein [Clostridiales bacterium]
MKLIDADELKDWITGHCDIELDEATEGEILRVIDDQFTAFDVDKVVEQLKECERYVYDAVSDEDNYVIDTEKAIEIVKG